MINTPEEAIAETPQARLPVWFKVVVGIPLVLVGGILTLLFGVFLGSYLLGRIGGCHPINNLCGLVVTWTIFGGLPLAAAVAMLGSSASRRFWWRLLVVMLFLSIAAVVDGSYGPNNWRRVFGRERLPGTDASKLQKTIVSPHLEVPIAVGTNVLWCGTFQLAWNEACRLVGGDIQFDKPDPISAVLNKHLFIKDSLDEPAYIATAGFVKDGIYTKIQKAIETKFGRTFKAGFAPAPGLTSRSGDLVAYACLYKTLGFPVVFERLDEALSFQGARVPAFGIEASKTNADGLYRQVLILDYQGEDEFVIELKTRSLGDRLILAKTSPKQTLAETVASIQSRIAGARANTATTNDVLVVPRLKLDLTREFSEIQGLRLVSTNRGLATNLYLVSALQSTKFEMNEKGVELRSESHMAFGCAKEPTPPVKHIMIFDKPFLVMMQRTNTTAPFFALWVDNREVLVAWK